MNAAKDFEKGFFKLMINSVYGKKLENLLKRINVRLINSAEDFSKYTSKPTYITLKFFGKYYAAIYEIKPVLKLNKPIYVGFTVLDLSKWKMYDFHTILSKRILMLNYCLLTQTALLMEKNQKMFMKNLSGKNCLTLVIIQKIQSFLMKLIKSYW